MAQTPTARRAASLNGRLGAARRYRPDEDHTDLAREAKVASLEEYLERVVAEEPALTNADRLHLADFLAGSVT